jgi:SAM-dependent methyltransferase
VPILVREPDHYLHAERAALAHTLDVARQHRENLGQLARATGLPEASVFRHRDVIDAEIGRTETFLELFDAAAVPAGDGDGTSRSTRPSGWLPDALLPYLLRDWTGTPELAAVAARINTALAKAVPNRSTACVVFAACGAGGVLTAIDRDFAAIMGFDLTLPVLLAARRLLDGENLGLVLPRCISPAGHITLHRSAQPAAGAAVDIAAMDAFDTVFARGSVDCVVTSFLIDLIPDPRRLAREIHRILRSDGVWINYGPSGPLKALWRFDRIETGDFMEELGFTVTDSADYRTTYLDLSRDCPAWSFQNHICYLTCARKTSETVAGESAALEELAAVELSTAVPQHFPGAELIERSGFRPESKRSTVLRHEGIPGRPQTMEVGRDAGRLFALVDDTRTVGEIAELLAQENPTYPVEETLRAFAHYFSQGLLRRRGL